MNNSYVNFAEKVFNFKNGTEFLAKFDTSGKMLWFVNSINSSGGSEYASIEISKNRDYFFSGSIANGGSFVNYNGPLPKENSNGFIAKCDRQGNIYWIRKYIDYHFGIYNNWKVSEIPNFKIDKNENVYFAGILDDSSRGCYMTIANKTYKVGKREAFLVSFDSMANLRWITFDTINHFDGLNFIQKDNDDNIYTVAPVYPNYPNDYHGYNMLEKYNDKGKKILSKPYYSNKNPYIGYYLRTGKFNDLYIVRSDTNMAPGIPGHVFIIKMNSNFDPVWTIIDKGYSSTPAVNGNGLTINPETGYLYLDGEFSKNINLGGIKVSLGANDTNYNGFIAKIDTGGNVLWIKNTNHMGNTITNHNSELMNQLCVEDACNNFYLLLAGEKEVHFEDINIDNTSIKNIFYTGFLAKYSSDSLGFIQTGTGCTLNLTNRSKSVFQKFQWFAALPTDSTYGRLIANTRDLHYKFPHKGRYVITLRGEKTAGCSNIFRDTFVVQGSPVSGFTSADTQGCQYVNFNFTDTSHADTINQAAGEHWAWDFGDGAALNYTTKRPVVSHVYTKDGTYTVKLVYSNGFCTDTFVSQKKVNIIPAPEPGFIVTGIAMHRVSTPDTISGCAPLGVQVHDNGQAGVVKRLFVVREIHPLPPPAGNMDSFKVASFNYQFKTPGLYVIHQYLTGTTGCITEDSVIIRVWNGVGLNDTPVVLRATFNDRNQVEIHWKPMAGVKEYTILKNQPKGSWAYLATTADTSISDRSSTDLFSPSGVGGHGWQFQYQIFATDSCGNTSALSNIARPVILSGKNIDNDYFNLQWSPYAGWMYGVQKYDVELQQDNGQFNLIDIVFDTSYKDINHFNTRFLSQCYRVKATELNGNRQTSYSNIQCIPFIPKIWIPEVFTPNNNSLNDSFKIVTVGIQSYNLTIYNRWGEVVYYGNSTVKKSPSGDSGVAWDGAFHGQQVPEGIYFYMLTAKTSSDFIYRKGTIEVQR
jgi:gliding motility-associated-like protein